MLKMAPTLHNIYYAKSLFRYCKIRVLIIHNGDISYQQLIHTVFYLFTSYQQIFLDKQRAWIYIPTHASHHAISLCCAGALLSIHHRRDTIARQVYQRPGQADRGTGRIRVWHHTPPTRRFKIITRLSGLPIP